MQCLSIKLKCLMVLFLPNLAGRYHKNYSKMDIKLNSEVSVQLSFLLMDNADEYDTEFKNFFLRFEAFAEKNYYCNFYANFQNLLQCGRRKEIRYWDLKMLCALTLIVRFYMTILGIPMCEPTAGALEDESVKSDRPDEKLQDLLYYCKFVNGKEDIYFSALKMKIYKLLCGSNFTKILIILKSLCTYTHSASSMGEDLETMICSQTIHPLSIAFRSIANWKGNHSHQNTWVQPLNVSSTDVDGLIEHIENDVKENAYIINQDPEGIDVARGECLIINQIFENVYDSNGRCYYRPGTEQDENDLKLTWEKLGCKGRITVHRDLDESQMIEAFKAFQAKLKESKPDYMVIAILSHGRNINGVEFIVDTNLVGVRIQVIKDMFIDRKKCPCMVGKAKLFSHPVLQGRKNAWHICKV